MCYYNGVKVTRVEYIRLKQLEKLLAQYDFLDQPMQIGFDYTAIPVLKKIEGVEDFEVVKMEWGFIPDTWFRHPIDTRAKAERFRKGFPNLQGEMMPGITTLNATAEELLIPGKIYRESALQRRCLVLSTGFYEWRHINPIGKKGQPLKTTVKYPYHISLREQEYFYIAAIWKGWKDFETGEYVETVAVITTAA